MRFDSFIAVNTPASSLALLTITQLRNAVGVNDASQDTALTELGNQVSAAISKAGRIESDGVNPPTLLSETITQTWRHRSVAATGDWPFASSERLSSRLMFARFPVTSVISVTADGVLLDPADYELRAADGALVRLSAGCEISWLNWSIVAQYVAGFVAVPADLALIAKQLVQILWWQDGKDPNQKMDWTDGLSRSEWFANPHEGDLIPPALLGALEAGGFINRYTG